MSMDRRPYAEEDCGQAVPPHPPPDTRRKANGSARPSGEPYSLQRNERSSALADFTAVRLGAQARSAELDAASVFAHELAQPLSAIANYVQACRTTLVSHGGEVPDRALECIEKAIEESARASQVFHRLRSLMDHEDLERTAEDINAIVERSSAELSPMAREHAVKLELALDRSLPFLQIDRIQVQLAIANLIRNSIEALRDRQNGSIAIRTNLKADDLVAVIISDNGPGLPPQIARRTFKPIRSHKPDGMGVGLSICHAIVSAHGGRLSASSQPGKGTDFHILLPTGEAMDEQVDRPCGR
ncbi:sensor histidine kinase [Pelagibius sp.]|uniref:sensor histidine kinase n=1 Tax=Pelagibius sp. TaxID=1931238 RepID=UPI002601AB33|nr:ATP-binding protein [Pelagibius sp.]